MVLFGLPLVPAVLLGVLTFAVACFASFFVFIAYLRSTIPKPPKEVVKVHVDEREREFAARREKFFTYSVQKYGRTYATSDGLVWTAEPKLVQELLMNQSHVVKRSRIYTLAYLFLSQVGLLGMDGPMWKRHTRTLLPVFQPSNVAPYIHVMHENVIRHVETWIASGGGGSNGLEAFRLLLSDVILVWGMGIAPESELALALRPYMENAGNGILDMAAKPGMFGAIKIWYKLLFGRRMVSKLLAPHIEQMRKNNDDAKVSVSGTNFIRQMVENNFTPKELAEELLHIYGLHKAAALNMLGLLFLLSRTPSRSTADSPWVARLRDEFRRVIKPGCIPTREDVPKLELMGRIINEGLRMMPATFVPFRQTGEPLVTEEGAVIKAGQEVGILVYALHNDPELWDDPETFNPDRFLEAPKPYSFIPFLLGKRMCAGKPFAKLELAVMLHALLMNYDITIPIDEIPYKPSNYTAWDCTVPFRFSRYSPEAHVAEAPVAAEAAPVDQTPATCA